MDEQHFRMRTRCVLMAGLAAVFFSIRLHAQDCKLNPTRAMRGQQITLGIPVIAAATTGNVVFKTMNSSDVYTDPTIVPVDKEPKVYTVPSTEELPAGSYSITFATAKQKFSCPVLTIAPPKDWPLKLFQFDPPGTYDTEKAFVKSETDQADQVDTVRVTLHGSGFMTDLPEDNRVLMNGRPLTVTWSATGCTQTFDGGTKLMPIAKNQLVLGQVITADRIELCRVPVPSGDVMSFGVAIADLPPSQAWPFRFFRWTTVPVGLASISIALALALLVLVLVHVLKSAQPNPSQYNVLKILFLDQETNTYSLSKFQFYWWTAAALFGYTYLVVSRVIVQGQQWPDMPGGLPAIVGIGAGASIGSLIVTGVRGPKGGGPEEPSLGDLVTTGGAAAPDRVQMLVWTILGVAAFCLAVLKHTPGEIKDLDPVPTGLLYMMGLSAAGYLGGKIARKAGPVVNEISITPQQSDNTLAAGAASQPSGPPNFSAALAVANAAAGTLGSPPIDPAKSAVDAVFSGIKAVSDVRTQADAQALVNKLNGFTTVAQTQAKAAADAFKNAPAQSEAKQAAEITQKAAAVLHDLSAAVTPLVSPTATPAAPKLTRVIELRGRNLSNQALIQIDGANLPFRMLVPNPDAKAEPLPQIVVREPDDPTLAMILRLTIDPNLLEDPDFQQFKRWFGAPSAKKTLSLTNLDGQKSEISFSVF